MPCLYGITFAVSDIPISVRPWNAWSNATTARPPGRLARDLDRVLDRLRAGVREHRLRRTVDRRERVQPLGELDVRLVRRHVEARVRVELCLTLDGGDHLGRGVADVQHRDPRREVDQPVAVDVLDDRARRAGGDDRMEVRDPGGDRGGAPREPLRALRARDLGDQLPFLWDVHARKCDVGRRTARRRAGRPDRPRLGLYRMSNPGLPGAHRRALDAPFRTIVLMALTVRDIVSIPGMPLRLLAGEDGADRPVRWVHSSELEDPTAWLKGGELILTTGMGVGTRRRNSEPMSAGSSEAGVAGLGFGLGFGHDKTPRAIVTEADKQGFPLFEVPYPVPFIAITEAVFTRLAAEQYDRSAARRRRRARADARRPRGRRAWRASADRSPTSFDGWALLLDLHGIALVSTGADADARRARVWDAIRGSRPDASATFSLTVLDEADHVWVQPVGAQGRVEAFLAVGTPEQPTQLDRIVAGHALSLFAIELAKSRAVADAERRLARGLLRRAGPRGSLPPAEAARGLARFGFARDAEVAVIGDRAGRRRPRPDAACARRDRPVLAARGRVPRLADRERDQRAVADRSR